MLGNIMIASFYATVVQVVVDIEVTVMVSELWSVVFINLGEVVVCLTHGVRDNLHEELLR